MSNREHIEQMANEFAAQCWCTPETQGIVMDERLAKEFARVLGNWLDMAAQMQRNADFYRGIVEQIGEMLGDEAKTADDGTHMGDVLALKVPELVAARLALTQAGATHE